MRALLAVVALSTAALACRTADGRAPEARAAAPPADSGNVGVTREEDLRLFRAGLPPVDSLAGGAPSRDALVRRFIAALEKSDTAALRDMLLTRAEFAYLYYPTTPQGLPPYDLNASLLWFMQSRRGEVGAARLLTHVAGRPLGYLGYECDPLASREGENAVWGPCTLRFRDGKQRLFGLIIGRGGKYKFVSYANKLD